MRKYSHFAALVAHVTPPIGRIIAAAVRPLVHNERPFPAEPAIAMRTGERLLGVRQMRQPVRIEEARPRDHVAALLALEGGRLQMARHVHDDGRIAMQRSVAAAHVASLLVLLFVVGEQIAQSFGLVGAQLALEAVEPKRNINKNQDRAIREQ